MFDPATAIKETTELLKAGGNTAEKMSQAATKIPIGHLSVVCSAFAITVIAVVLGALSIYWSHNPPRPKAAAAPPAAQKPQHTPPPSPSSNQPQPAPPSLPSAWTISSQNSPKEDYPTITLARVAVDVFRSTQPYVQARQERSGQFPVVLETAAVHAMHIAKVGKTPELRKLARILAALYRTMHGHIKASDSSIRSQSSVTAKKNIETIDSETFSPCLRAIVSVAKSAAYAFYGDKTDLIEYEFQSAYDAGCSILHFEKADISGVMRYLRNSLGCFGVDYPEGTEASWQHYGPIFRNDRRGRLDGHGLPEARRCVWSGRVLISGKHLEHGSFYLHAAIKPGRILRLNVPPPPIGCPFFSEISGGGVCVDIFLRRPRSREEAEIYCKNAQPTWKGSIATRFHLRGKSPLHAKAWIGTTNLETPPHNAMDLTTAQSTFDKNTRVKRPFFCAFAKKSDRVASR